MTEPTLDEEVIAKGLAIRGKTPAEVAAGSGVPVEWIETNWGSLTYRAPALKKPKWGGTHAQRRKGKSWGR